jgi:hypothetical protein
VKCRPVGSADGIIWTRSRWKKPPNLYVEIKVEESAMQSTMIIKGNRAPLWKEKFILYV